MTRASCRFLILVFLCASLNLIQAESPNENSLKPSNPVIQSESEDGSRRLTTDGSYKHRPVWGLDGKTLYYARHESGGNTIFLRKIRIESETEPERVTRRKDPEYHASVSPDGSRILFTQITLSGTQGNLDIAVIPTDGKSDPRLVAGDHGKLSHQDWPSWLPDGKRFVFQSTHEGNQELYLGSIDDSTPLKRLTQSPGQDVHPAVSPDGRTVMFATDRWHGLELATLDLETLKVTRMTQSPRLDDYPSYSPDGRFFTFVSNRTGNLEIWLGDFEGNLLQLTKNDDPDLFPAVTPDGDHVSFLSGRPGEMDIFLKPIPQSWRDSKRK